MIYRDRLPFMLSYNEITARKYIVLDSTPYEVVNSHVSRKQSQKPINQTKLKNLITKKVIEKNFHSSDNVEEAEINTQKLKYLYKKEDRKSGVWEYWFSNPKDSKDRFMIPQSIAGDATQFITENSDVTVLFFNEEIIGLKIPIKVTLKVKEAPPAVRGNTAHGGSKIVTLETGVTVSTPLFINEGDSVVINTETGEYVERA